MATVPLLLGILTLVFVLIQFVPGRPFTLEPGAGTRPEAAEHLRQIFGADRPLVERYFAWMRQFLMGDLGVSYALRRPVAGLVREAAANTVVLAGLALLLQFLLGAAAGVAAAAGHSVVDRLVSSAAALLYAIPSFWLALVLVSCFSVRLGWLPVSQMHSPDAGGLEWWPRILDALRHLALPCLSLALPAAGGVALYVRDEVRAGLGRGFVRAALSRGLSRREIVLRHGLSAARLPLITLFGLDLPGLVGGSTVIEMLFAWPGMGRLAYQAALSRDEPVILACAWIASLFVILGSLASDLLAAAADPRVRESLR